MPVVNDTMVRPDLTPITQARVEIRTLLNGVESPVYTASQEIFPKVVLHPDATGLISVTLPANSTLTPAGSEYQAAISIPGEDVRYETFIVPAGAGPYLLGSILSVTPAAGIPFISTSLPLPLAATALAGTTNKVSDAGHVHPWDGLATDAEIAAAIATHESDTTAVHGITDTTDLARKSAANTWALAQTGPLIDLGGAVFNVKAYGALGNNSHDDTTNLQAALDAGAGSIVFVPEGDYKITASLVCHPDTTIIGCGNLSRIVAVGGSFDAITFSGPGADNLRIFDLGGTQAGGNTGAFISLHDVIDSWLVRCYGHAFKVNKANSLRFEACVGDNHGWNLSGVFNSTFVGCLAYGGSGTDSGWLIDDCRDNTFTACLSAETAQNGFKLTNSERNTFLGCVAENPSYTVSNTYSGFYLDPNAHANVFVGGRSGNHPPSSPELYEAHGKYGVEIISPAARNKFIGVNITQAATAPFLDGGAGTVKLMCSDDDNLNLGTSGQMLAPDGTGAAPGWAYSGRSGMGVYRRATTRFTFVDGGIALVDLGAVGLCVGSGGVYSWGASAAADSSPDLKLARSAAGSMTIGGQANGQLLGIKTLTELTTIAAAATTDTAILLPAGAIILAVTTRVTVAIPTATTFTVGDSGNASRFSTAAISTAANTTDKGSAAGAYYNPTATAVRITPNATPAANTGRVRVTVMYLDPIAATS